MKIGFIGLGQMGRGMAARLIERGYRVTVWNRTRSAAEPFLAQGARIAERPREALEADVVITMLADDAAVEAVWIRPQLVRDVPATTVHLNMASVSLRMGQELAQLHRAAGSPYLSAPVFGRPHAAASGELDIVAAGPDAALERCVPLFEALGRRWFNVGAEPHRANIVKIARNFLLGSIIESLGTSPLSNAATARRSGHRSGTTSPNAPAFSVIGREASSMPGALALECAPPRRDAPAFVIEAGYKKTLNFQQAGVST